MKKILAYVMFFRVIWADIMYLTCRGEEKERLLLDLERYARKDSPYDRACLASLNFCLLYGNTFRNVFYFRMKKYPILKLLSKVFISPVATVEIGGDIGGGLRINHMNAVVYPYSAGRNLTVGPNVVIGKGPKKDNGDINAPIIGDNVTIMPNAVVSGGIKVGSDTWIGAGTIVVKSIPDKCVVVGNPARVLSEG